MAMIGVLNVLYENAEGEVRQYYRALERSFAEAGLAYRVHVIDNSRSPLGHLVPDGGAYAHHPENIGYTRACNLLMADAFGAGCDVVVAMNLDGFPLPGCIADMMATLRAHGCDALVEARQFPREHPRVYDRKTGATDWVSGCCLMIGRRTWERLGPLDEGLFLYCEDVDYSFRARLAGVPCLVSDGAFFFHRGHIHSLEPLRRKNALLSSRYLAMKWCNATMRQMMEEALVSEGFFASVDEMPPLPPGVTAHRGITWNPESRMTFASARWIG